MAYADRATGVALVRDGDRLINADGATIARFREGVARFVDDDGYAGSFGFQWNAARTARSEHPMLRERHHATLAARTRFDEHDMTGKVCLEIGCGSGDDTDYLLTLPFGEIHAVDLSHAIDRAARRFEDPRLRLAQADANALPFAEGSFDVVFIHRVMQHTPHPAATLARAAGMVKPGGLLFAHSYHRSLMNSRSAKYKYRWLTRRLPKRLVWHTLRATAPALHGVNRLIAERGPAGRELVRRWSPLVLMDTTWPEADRRTLVDLEAVVSFDALTPRYDLPMWSRDFIDLVRSMGFRVLHADTEPWLPLTVTARREA
ncbi:MAG: class I SAM-dependent methyltransferase [Planctomycetota bacterium]